MNKLNNELRETAIGYGLCQKWQDEWNRDYSVGELIEKFYTGIDFCIEHNYPTNDFIKSNFGKEVLRDNNILVDDKFSLLNPTNAAVFGNSETKVRFNARNHGRIWCKDKARVSIYARNSSFVIVHVFDSAIVEADGRDSSKLIVIRHSNECKITCYGKAEEKEELNMFN